MIDRLKAIGLVYKPLSKLGYETFVDAGVSNIRGIEDAVEVLFIIKVQCEPEELKRKTVEALKAIQELGIPFIRPLVFRKVGVVPETHGIIIGVAEVTEKGEFRKGNG